jgi:two-component system, NtrC family, response regulator AtoC
MTTSQPTCADDTQSILIVDDDKNILELLAEGFKLCGFNVIKAQDGLVAWQHFKNEPIDIVLTDIRMPGLNGIELSSRIRNHSPHTIIAVMTGGDADIGKRILNDGLADYFFTKPFAISSVCKILSLEAQTT